VEPCFLAAKNFFMKILSKIKLSTSNSVFISCVKSKRFLILKKEPFFFDFIIIPLSVIKLFMNKKEIIVWGGLNCESLSFLTALTLFKNSCILKKKKISLQGLGFKIFYNQTSHLLSFKLGYSHLIFFAVEKGIKLITIGKNYLIVSGFNSGLLGNFLHNIQQLRFPDSYKGKGFWKKYEKKTLKLFKKK
jgi:hypothetical protein